MHNTNNRNTSLPENIHALFNKRVESAKKRRQIWSNQIICNRFNVISYIRVQSMYHERARAISWTFSGWATSFFLFEKLKEIILSLMSRFMRSETIDGSRVRKLIQMDLTDSAKLVSDQSGEFRKNSKEFHVKIVMELAERCPLAYNLTFYISSLSPTHQIIIYWNYEEAFHETIGVIEWI